MKKTFAKPGKSTSNAEVTHITSRGFWLLVDEREIFVAFSRFPWFREASVRSIVRVKRPSAGHLHWPGLDIDLALESISHPERYPLVSRSKTHRKSKLARSPRSRS